MYVVYERVLIGINGEKLLFTVGKDGILWKLDPRTGQYVDLTETVYQDVYERQSRVGQADLSDGHPRGEGGQSLRACPANFGGHDWQASELREKHFSKMHGSYGPLTQAWKA